MAERRRTTTSIPSTRNEPTGPLLGEKNISSNKYTSLKSNNVSETDKTNKSSLRSTTTSIPSTRNGPSGLLLGERNNSIKSASLMLSTKTVESKILGPSRIHPSVVGRRSHGGCEVHLVSTIEILNKFQSRTKSTKFNSTESNSNIKTL